MPHCILEHSHELPASISMQELCIQLHKTVMAYGLFKPETIKTRAKAFDTYCCGEDSEKKHFCHVSLILLEGRSSDACNALAQNLHQKVKEHCPEIKHITVHLQEVPPSLYAGV